MVSKVWHLGTRQLTIEKSPLVMGILNLTPDSFSDGGKYETSQVAIATALQMQSDGADIIDIGGETILEGNMHWDTRNSSGELIVSGVYLYKVDIPEKDSYWGRLVVIR